MGLELPTQAGEAVEGLVQRFVLFGEMQPDEDEFVEVVRLPIAEVEKMIERDEIRDAKTVAAMYRAKLKNLY